MQLRLARQLLLAFCLTGMATGCAPKTNSGPAPVKSAMQPLPKGTGTIYLVPCGDYPPSEAQRMAVYFKEKYHIPIEVLKIVDEASALDTQTHQVSGQSLSTLIRNQYAALDAKPNNFFIGLTSSDLNMDGEGLNYVLTYRESDNPSDGLAITSKSRFVVRSSDGVQNRELVQQRMQKMIAKSIGLLYFHLKPSDDPNSVLFSHINSPADVDTMSEDF